MTTTILGQSDVSFTSVVQTSVNYTAKPGDFVLADASAGAISITLPAPNAAVVVTVKKTDSTTNAVNIVGTVDGVTNASLTAQNQATHLTADSFSYHTVATASAAGSGDLLAANNLSDVASPSTALANLGGVSSAALVATPMALGNAGVPASSLGYNGDTAIDTTPVTGGTVYTKSGGAWASNYSLALTSGTTFTGEVQVTTAPVNPNDVLRLSDLSSFNTVLPTVGIPSSATGANGDAAIDFSTWLVYTKTSGAWSLTGRLTTGPGASFKVTTAGTSNVTVPAGVSYATIVCIGGGGGGGGGGAAALTSGISNQAGGGGGGAGCWTEWTGPVTAGEVLSLSVGSGGVGGVGGAASTGTTGNAGNRPSTTTAQSTTVTGNGVSIMALGGSAGLGSGANTSTGGNGGVCGAALNYANTGGAFPGCGGAGGIAGGSAFGKSASGGGGGGTASATLGGGAGYNGSISTPAYSGGVGTSATTSGVSGTNATVPGAGGGGGGGGAPGGAGGNGAAGAPGMIEIYWIG